MSDICSISGHVYLLTNPAMPGLVKIGFTTSDAVESRMKQLYSTGVPVPFECVYSKRLDNYKGVEQALNVAFGDNRVNLKREFFRIDPARVMAILEILPGVEEDVSEDAGSVDQSDIEALDKEKKRRANFKFSMIGLGAGTQLVWRRDPTITCTVHDDRMVEFEGHVRSLSESANIVNQREGHKCTAMPGTEWWLYGEQTLAAIRLEKEEDE